MWRFMKIAHMTAEIQTKGVLFLMQSALHYWPVANLWHLMRMRVQCATVYSSKQRMIDLPTTQAINVLYNTKAFWHNHFCSRKAISITYSKCVSVALIRHAMRVRNVIFSHAACLVLPYFPHCLIKGTIFSKTLTFWHRSFTFKF